MKTISSVGEFGLIQKITAPLKLKKEILLGPGDDAAVVRFGTSTLIWTTDLLIEGRHFRRDWMTAYEIGFKAMRVNLSDIAAMGGRPLYALVSAGLPKSLALAFAADLFRGLRQAGEEAGCAIVGGDTNASDRLILNVALAGEAPFGRFLTRGGARVGDGLYVTGTIGGSALGLKALQKGRRRGYEPEIRAHLRPPLRLDIGRYLTRLKGMHAMIDLSDGLAGDLGHILDRSGVGAEIDVSRLPLPAGFERRARSLGADPRALALSGGEDYELLFAASPRVKIPQKIHGVPVTKIGRITRKRDGLRWVGRHGEVLPRARGFRHF